MKMDYGFVEFYDKEDKMASSFFKEANNRDILGLRKMNIRISNVLFPFGNTLMPNLVYFYYLNAIYHALKKKRGKIPSAKEIDEYEILISQSIYEQQCFKKKGFFNDAKNRAYGKYKSNMSRMHFLEENWKAHPKLKESALESLKKTERYQFVEALIKDEKKEIVFPQGVKWPDKLEDAERLDFIRRVVLPYKGETPEYSVFANIVMYHAMIVNKPGNIGQTIYRDDWMDDYNDDRKKQLNHSNDLCKSGRTYNFSRIEAFDNLHKYFNDIVNGQERDKLKNRKRDYEIALAYSKLQLIAKLAYNVCLFENMGKEQEEYLKSLKKELKDVRSAKEWERMLENFRGKEYNIFMGINPGEAKRDADLERAFDFVKKIAECIKNADVNDGEEVLIKRVKEIVKARESEIMGDNSILNSGIRADKAMADYVDTFRWQYRPEYAYEEAVEVGEVVEEDIQLPKEKNKEKTCIWKYSEEYNDLNTMSASYYIYELYFEPYEEVK